MAAPSDKHLWGSGLIWSARSLGVWIGRMLFGWLNTAVRGIWLPLESSLVWYLAVAPTKWKEMTGNVRKRKEGQRYRLHIHVCIEKHVHEYTHTYTHIHTHNHIYTHTHIYTHIPT